VTKGLSTTFVRCDAGRASTFPVPAARWISTHRHYVGHNLLVLPLFRGRAGRCSSNGHCTASRTAFRHGKVTARLCARAFLALSAWCCSALPVLARTSGMRTLPCVFAGGAHAGCSLLRCDERRAGSRDHTAHHAPACHWIWTDCRRGLTVSAVARYTPLHCLLVQTRTAFAVCSLFAGDLDAVSTTTGVCSSPLAGGRRRATGSCCHLARDCSRSVLQLPSYLARRYITTYAEEQACVRRLRRSP